MWLVIKAEYEYGILSKIWAILLALVVFTSLIIIIPSKTGFLLMYLFFSAFIFTLYDDGRYNIYHTLPLAINRIAFIRLIMLGINFSIVIVFLTPLVAFIKIGALENISQIFFYSGLLILARIITYILADIISGHFSKKRKKLLLGFSLLLLPIIIAFISITTIYFRHPDLNMILITLSFSLIPLLAFLSIKTFSAKEILYMKELVK